MNKTDWTVSIGLFIIAFLSRVPFVEKFQSHWDGPQYSLAIVSYSLQNSTPAAPGYPIYIALGALINTFLQNPHTSLLVIGVLISAFGAVIFYLFGKILKNRIVGLIAAVIYITSPVIYFFGLTVYAYGVVAVVVVTLGLVIYGISFKKRKWPIYFGVLLALLLGIRPQESLLIGGLVVFGVLHLKRKDFLVFLVSFMTVLLLWLIPYINVVGGIEKAIQYNFKASQTAIPAFTLIPSAEEIMTLLKGAVLTLGISLFGIFYYLRAIIQKGMRIVLQKNMNLLFFIVSWVIVPFAFNFFIRSDHAGYQLTYLSAFFIINAYGIYMLFHKKRLMLLAAIALCVAFNFFIFFRNRDPYNTANYIPTSFHYSEIRKNDLWMQEKTTYIQRHFAPEESIIILADADLWRPLSYHLPNFNVILIPGLENRDKRYINLVLKSQNNKTLQSTLDNGLFEVPKTTKTLIIFDNNGDEWVRNARVQKVQLKGNSMITILNINSVRKFKIGVEYFEAIYE